MKKINFVIFAAAFFAASFSAYGQTAYSLFWRSDSLQVNEIVSEVGDQYRKVGHHGPAVENTHLR